MYLPEVWIYQIWSNPPIVSQDTEHKHNSKINQAEKFGKIMCICHSMDHISMHKQNFIKIHSLFLKILRKIEFLTSIKGHNSVEKFGKIHVLVIILLTQNLIKIHQFVFKILNGNKILTSIKGHNSVEKWWKLICNCPYLHFVHINAFTKFYQNPPIGPQDNVNKRNLRHQPRAITLLKMKEKYCSIIQIYILSMSTHIQDLTEIHKLIHKILSINKTLTSIKGHNSIKNRPKITCIRNNMDLVYINAYTKLYQNSSICS